MDPLISISDVLRTRFHGFAPNHCQELLFRTLGSTPTMGSARARRIRAPPATANDNSTARKGLFYGAIFIVFFIFFIFFSHPLLSVLLLHALNAPTCISVIYVQDQYIILQHFICSIVADKSAGSPRYRSKLGIRSKQLIRRGLIQNNIGIFFFFLF